MSYFSFSFSFGFDASLGESGEKRLSETDPEARFARDGHGHFPLGYTAEIAVSEDHFIVTQRITQAKNDNHALLPLVDAVAEECQQPPGCVLADAAFSSQANLQQMEARGIEAYIPDCNLASEMRGNLCTDELLPARDPRLLAMRHKLRTSAGRKQYLRRQGLVEPVFGTLKEHRGLRQFQRRGLAKVAVEFTLAALSDNLVRMYRLRNTR